MSFLKRLKKIVPYIQVGAQVAGVPVVGKALDVVEQIIQAESSGATPGSGSAPATAVKALAVAVDDHQGDIAALKAEVAALRAEVQGKGKRA